MLVLCVFGCTSDKIVSQENKNMASMLMSISQDMQCDTNAYLDRVKTERMRNIHNLEQLTLEKLEKDGRLTDDVKKAVFETFARKRGELESNVEKTREAYRYRIRALQQIAQGMVASDQYYEARNYKVWLAIGKGAAQGVMDKVFSIQTLMGSINTAPLAGDLLGSK